MPKQFDPKQWVRAHEGFRDEVYLDSRGLPTVGVGHLITETSPYYGAQVGDYVTGLEEQYDKDYAHHAELAAKNFKNFDKHPPHVQESLINMTFQMGNKPSKWKNFNKALQEGIETGNYQNAAYHASDSKWFRDQTPKRARSVLDRLAYGDRSTYAYERPEEFSELPDYAIPQGYEDGVPHLEADEIVTTTGRAPVPTEEEVKTLVEVLNNHPAYGGALAPGYGVMTYETRNPFNKGGTLHGFYGKSRGTGQQHIGVGTGSAHAKHNKTAADWANTIYHEYGHARDEAANKKYKGKHNKHWRARTAETLPPPGTATWRGPDRMKLEGHYPGDGHDHGPEDFLPEGFADGWWQDAKDTARGAKRGYQVYKAIDDYDTWARETPFVPAIYKWDEPTSWSTIREYAPDALKAAKYVGKAERKLEDWADTAGEYVDTARGWLGFADGIDWSRFSPEELEYFKTLPAEEQARMLGVAKAETALAVPPVAAEIPAWMVEPVQQENVVDKAQEDYTEAAADRHAKYREALGLAWGTGQAGTVGGSNNYIPEYPANQAMKGYMGGEWNVGLSEGLYKEIESMKLTNPEAGPSDTVPAMLTPGEAVIPASVAMDEDYKPLIKEMVEEGRERNDQAEAAGIPVNHPSVPGLADGGALDSKISKIYNEGYTAPGQAYAIAKSKGYQGGSDMIPKPMGAPPKYNIEEPDHSRFDQAEMGQGTSMMMTNAKHKQAIANKEGAQAQKMDHMQQTDMYKMQADAMKADQKLAQKMAEKNLEMQTKMMEADVDSEVARRKQQALSTSMEGLGMVPPMEVPPAREGTTPFGDELGMAMEQADTLEALQGFSPVHGYADGVPFATTGNLDQSGIDDLAALIPPQVATPTGTAMPGEDVIEIPREDIPPAPPVEDLSGAHFMDLSGRVDPAAEAELKSRGFIRQGGRWVQGEKAVDESFAPAIEPIRAKVEAGEQLDPQEKTTLARYAEEKSVGQERDAEANQAAQIQVAEQQQMKDQKLAETNEQRAVLGLDPIPATAIVDSTTTPDEVDDETTKAATDAATNADPEQRKEWYEHVGGWFKDAFGTLINEQGLAEAALVYGANRLLGYDNDTAGNQALKWYGNKLNQEQQATADQATRAAEIQDYALKKQIDAGITKPADAAKLRREQVEKGRKHGEEVAAAALKNVGQITVDKGGYSSKENVITLTDKAAGGQFEKFLTELAPKGSPIDHNAPGVTQAMDNAVRAAVAHAQETGEDVQDITPFLWAAYIPESTGRGAQDFQGIPAKRMTELTSRIPVPEGQSKGTAIQNSIRDLQTAYAKLAQVNPKAFAEYEAKKPNGFYNFARERLDKLK